MNLTSWLISIINMAPPQGGAESGGPLMQIMPFVIILGVMYLLLIRPQKKKLDEHQKFLSSLEKGSDVVTNSGIIGKVTGISKTVITLEVAPKIKVRFLRNAISGLAPKAGEETESDSGSAN